MPPSVPAHSVGFWRTPSNLYTALWLLAACGFAGAGLRAVWPEVMRARQPSTGPDAALEMHADFAAEKPGALGPLRAVIERLPTARGILILQHPQRLSAALGSQVIHYLAWPRPVELQESAPGAQGEDLDELRGKYSALALCGWHAPEGFSHVRRIGPGLEIVLLSGAPLP